jgi:monoamine oxidase
MAGAGAAAGAAIFDALPAAKVMAARTLPLNPGVVIIGGGIAGLTAAMTLNKANIPNCILEARERLGGRAYTESKTFGVPYDHGATWYHSANINPLLQQVRSHAFDIVDDNAKETVLFMDGKEATQAQYDALEKSLEKISYQVDYGNETYEKAGHDLAIGEVIPIENRTDYIAHAMTGALEQGVETYHLSLYDKFQQKDTADEALAKEGCGYSAVKTLSEGAQVYLGTPVRHVNWVSSDIVVTTDIGPVHARAVIVTVPPILIGEKRIRFDPPMPPEKWMSIKTLPMGLVDKVAFSFESGYMKGIKPNTVALIQNNENGPVWRFHLRPQGQDLAVGYIGGRHAKVLNQQPPTDVKRAGLGALMSAFGGELKNHVVASHYTNWLSDPWSHGSFTCSRVGANYSRTLFAKSLSRRLFFAGEACSIEWSGQLTGAYLTGIDAAKEVMRRVKF